MKVKTFTLSFVNEECGFVTDDLDDFVADKKIFDVRDHFFIHEGWPYWAILLTYEEPAPEKTLSVSFTPSQQRLFDALKAWRLSRARADKCPAYIIMHDRILVEIVRRLPESVTDLTRIRGIGESKSQKYGQEIQEVIRQWRENPSPSA